MKLKSITLSEAAIVDTQSNQLSIINIIESTSTPGPLPALYPKFTIVTIWERDDISNSSSEEIAKFRISHKSKSVNKVIGEVDIKIPKNIQTFRSIASLNSIPISDEGINEMVAELKVAGKWKMVGSAQFLVTVNTV